MSKGSKMNFFIISGKIFTIREKYLKLLGLFLHFLIVYSKEKPKSDFMNAKTQKSTIKDTSISFHAE